MRTVQRSGSARSDTWRLLAALVAAFALVAGCQATASPAPTDGRSTAAASQPARPSQPAQQSPSGQPSPSSSTPGQPSQSARPSGTPSDAGAPWQAAGTMATARISPHAVLLGDGRVLVVGDDGESGGVVSPESARAELWDPATAAWRTTESLNAPRGDFVAVSTADGRALVTGGFNQDDQSYSSTYVYDPRAGGDTWSKAGLLGTARTAPAAAVLADGRVLVAGGYYRTKPNFGHSSAPGAVLAAYHLAQLTGADRPGPRLADVAPPNVGAALATAELFDPATGSWSSTGPMKYARFGARAVTLADGRVLVVGCGPSESGVTVDDGAAESAEIFDPATGRFSLAGRLPEIDLPALARLGVPITDAHPQAADNGTLVALRGGGAVLVGHAGWWKHYADITRSFRFDPATTQWREIGQPFAVLWLPDSGPVRETPGILRLHALVARLPDGRVLVAGGDGAYQGATPNGANVTATAEAYDPATDTWSPLLPMPGSRAGGAAVVLAEGSVLLVGGYTEKSGEQGRERIVLGTAIRFVPSP